jgi:hypothetical protein
LWPIPRGEGQNPELKVPFQPHPSISASSQGWFLTRRFPSVVPHLLSVSDEEIDTTETPAAELAAFGSSGIAKVMLESLWGDPAAGSRCGGQSAQSFSSSVRGATWSLQHGISRMAESRWRWRNPPLRSGIGASVDQEQSLLSHPLLVSLRSGVPRVARQSLVK